MFTFEDALRGRSYPGVYIQECIILFVFVYIHIYIYAIYIIYIWHQIWGTTSDSSTIKLIVTMPFGLGLS